MIVYDNIAKVNIGDSTVVALGTFDGIHIGHREIIASAASIARAKGLKSVCYTFSNIPLNYIMGLAPCDERATHLICSEDEKLNLIEERGIDILVNVPFDESIMNMEASDFIKEVLVSKLHANTVCCGFNYSYGAHAGGNVETLHRDCQSAGIEVVAHDAVVCDGEVVSSTLIRQAIHRGDIETANKYLGRQYGLSGVVEQGQHIGTDIGYPTINCKMPLNMESPLNGVYFTRTIVDGAVYNSITNIGVRPTVSDNGAVSMCETHIFGFNGDLYARSVHIDFLKFVRPEKKFASIAALQEQIAADCVFAKDFFYTYTAQY